MVPSEASEPESAQTPSSSVWDAKIDDYTSQRDLLTTPNDQDAVTVYHLKIAQFVYLLMTSPEIRDVIDTIL